MKMSKILAILLVAALVLAGCTPTPVETNPPTDPPTQPPTAPVTDPPTDPPTEPATEPPTEPPTEPATEPATEPEEIIFGGIYVIKLSDDGITVGGAPAATEPGGVAYVANDIIYYEAGHDFTYGEGEPGDEHTADEAAAHTVVHITAPGIYYISGKLSKGQIAVDLGEDAKNDPNAVVTLVLNGVDITCEVAPAVIFYNVYECGSDDTETATYDVDTSAAGANVIIADGTVNNVKGSHVARIYKPGTQELNEAGTEVLDAKKLHKYDGAFYSKRSMNVNGGELGTGVLNIDADNEGLDTELHLTINGGNINIFSGNDGINTNEDGVSVTTVNGGTLKILVTGETGEGDGIDSNGWLVFNGGTVISAACSFSADAGIDSDMGIYLNGGTVMSTGGMLDHIVTGGQNYVVFSFSQKQDGTKAVTLQNEAGDAVLDYVPENNYTIMVFTSPDLTDGTYTLWVDGVQQAGVAGGVEGFGSGGGEPGGFGGSGGGEPGGSEGGESPAEGQQPAEGGSDGGEPAEGQGPAEGGSEGGEPGGSEGGEPAEGQQPPEDGSEGGEPGIGEFAPSDEHTTEFVIFGDENSYSQVGPAA